MSGAIKKFLEVAIANFFGTEKDCQAKEILKLRVVFFGLIRLQRKKTFHQRLHCILCKKLIHSDYKEKHAVLQHKGENVRFTHILSILRIAFSSVTCTVLNNTTVNSAVGDAPSTSQANVTVSNMVEISIAHDPDV